MTVYWETSRRPLFVKTVWTDGHRHPVLNKEDPLLHPPLKSTKRRRRKKPVTQTPASTEISDEEELNISSVRLLLTKNEEAKSDKNYPPRKEMRRVYSVDVITKDIIKTNSTKILHPHPITTFKIPIRGERQITTRDEKKEVSEEHYNILSERVMVWLDLAAQNGENLQLNRYQQIKYKERVNTCPCPKPPPPPASPSVDDETDDEIELQIKSVTEDCENYERNNAERIDLRAGEGYKQDVRRQLHIFIPDLQRRGDCDSVLTTSSL